MKNISQDFFDETVRSNIELFDQTEDEAIADAIESLRTQGADLGNIIEDMVKYPDGHPAELALNELKYKLRLGILNYEASAEEVFRYCEQGSAYRMFLSNLEAVDIILGGILEFHTLENCEGMKLLLKCLCSLIVGQSDVLNDGHLDGLLGLTNKVLLSVTSDDFGTPNLITLSYLYKVFRLSCVLNEPNRRLLSRSNIIDETISLLSKLAIFVSIDPSPDRDHGANNLLLYEACAFLRGMTMDDDLRAEFGQGTETARAIADTESVLDVFIRLATASSASMDDQWYADIFLTVSTIITREDACLKFAELGGIKILFDALQMKFNSPAVCSACLALMRTLCGSDTCKLTVGNWTCGPTQFDGVQGTQGTVSGICLILDCFERYIANPSVAKQAASLLAAVTLRQPNIAKQIVSAGAPEFLTKALELHMSNSSVVRAICMAIRNCVSRSPELCALFTAGQVSNSGRLGGTTYNLSDMCELEKLLNQALSIRDCTDEAKAALRDLGYHVKLTEQWRGQLPNPVIR